LVKLGRQEEARTRLEGPDCPLPHPALYREILAPKKWPPSIEHIEAAVRVVVEYLRTSKDDKTHLRQAIDLCLALVDGMGWSPNLLDAMRRRLGEDVKELAAPMVHLLEQVMPTLWTKPRTRVPFYVRMPKKEHKFCNFVLEVYAHAGRWRHALRLLEQMRAKGPQPGGGSLVSAMAACAAAGRVDEALEVMRQAGYVQDAAMASNLYGAVIAACCSDGGTRPLVALYLLDEFRCRGGAKAKATTEVLAVRRP
jgi:pentatricopeptide repeat protein